MHQVSSDLGVSGILRDVFGSKRSTMLLTIATYMAGHGNLIEYIDDWFDENYLGNNVSPQHASLIFSSIKPDD
ncbi:MAG: hypothetical protein LBT47_10130 [Deltaproteobacteria bacterium]|nr:hypothetical protein [Deltaproteobacteria bacterium]